MQSGIRSVARRFARPLLTTPAPTRYRPSALQDSSRLPARSPSCPPAQIPQPHNPQLASVLNTPSVRGLPSALSGLSGGKICGRTCVVGGRPTCSAMHRVRLSRSIHQPWGCRLNGLQPPHLSPTKLHSLRQIAAFAPELRFECSTHDARVRARLITDPCASRLQGNARSCALHSELAPDQHSSSPNNCELPEQLWISPSRRLHRERLGQGHSPVGAVPPTQPPQPCHSWAGS